MATLEWIRDHYDSDRSRYIEESEREVAGDDWSAGTLSMPDYMDIINVCNKRILLPEYSGSTPMSDHTTQFNIPIGSVLEVDGVEVI